VDGDGAADLILPWRSGDRRGVLVARSAPLALSLAPLPSVASVACFLPVAGGTRALVIEHAGGLDVRTPTPDGALGRSPLHALVFSVASPRRAAKRELARVFGRKRGAANALNACPRAGVLVHASSLAAGAKGFSVLGPLGVSEAAARGALPKQRRKRPRATLTVRLGG
jgi:hypothetical protein